MVSVFLVCSPRKSSDLRYFTGLDPTTCSLSLIRSVVRPGFRILWHASTNTDCCVSFYHHTVNIPGYLFEGASFDDYFELFIEGKTDFGDYFDNVMSWHEHRNDPNVLFLTYEELKKDTIANVLKIAEFVGPQYKEDLLKNGDLLRDVIKHSSFTFMKEHFNRCIAELLSLPKDMIMSNPDLPPGTRDVYAKRADAFKRKPSEITFIRKGIVGDWKNHFSPEQSARLDKKFQERMGNTELAEIWKDVM